MRPLNALLPLALFSLMVPALAQTPTTKTGAPLKPASVLSGRSATSDSGELPIHRVVLYKNGVGYFEHRGRVSGDQELSIRFTTAQLNDVLKSLTVVDLGGGRIGGVRYNSVAPLSERLSTLRLALDGNTDRASFLNALRGARVEVHAPSGSASGRLLSVEEKTRIDKEGNELKSTEISLVSDSGELHTFDLTPATSVRILESEMNREVGRYLTLLASARDKDVRQMTISTAGEGSRELVVSYISEVPVWKSTYRIVLPKNDMPQTPGAKPLLQGWAVVDNTVGEDWKNIELSLVAGAPQSFIEQISQPYYVRRPVIELPKTALLTPQTHEGTLNEPAAQLAPAAPTIASGSAGGLGGVVSKAGRADRRYQQQFQRNETTEVNAAATDYVSNAPTEAYQSTFAPQSTGEALGDMFQYAIQQKVTVLQNQSALVPIVQARVDADKVTLWNDHLSTPLRALWLTNSSGLTLDAGSFNIVEDGAFAGEGTLAEVHPNERRLLSYAADTAVRVKSTYDYRDLPYTRIYASKGMLFMRREQRQTRTYTIANSDTRERTVVIEHSIRPGWKLLDKELKPEETSASSYRFKVKVGAGPAASKKLEVAEYYPQTTTIALSTFDDNNATFIFQTQEIKPEIKDQLRKLLDKRHQISAIQEQIKIRKDEMESIGREQSRIRENMKTLKGSTEEKALLQRYVSALNQQEDRLTVLKNEISTKELELNARQNEFNQTAESMTFEQTE